MPAIVVKEDRISVAEVSPSSPNRVFVVSLDDKRRLSLFNQDRQEDLSMDQALKYEKLLDEVEILRREKEKANENIQGLKQTIVRLKGKVIDHESHIADLVEHHKEDMDQKNTLIAEQFAYINKLRYEKKLPDFSTLGYDAARMGKARHRKRKRKMSVYDLNLSLGRERGGSSSDADGTGVANDPPRQRLSATLVRAALAEKKGEEEDSWEIRAHKIRFSNDWNELHQTLQSIRKLLAGKHPPIQEVIDAGMVPDFVALLKDAPQELIPAEAAWCLCNVTAGDHAQTEIVVKHGAVPILVDLVTSPVADIGEQALWALGNIAGDCAAFRDCVVEEPIVRAILRYKVLHQELTARRICVWVCGNLCKHHPVPSLDRIGPLVPLIAECLCSPMDDDRNTLLDALRALELFCGDTHNVEHNYRIARVCENTEITVRLLELLKAKAMPENITHGALHVVSCILSCAGQSREVMIQNGVLNPFRDLLAHPTPHIRKAACRVLAFITAREAHDSVSERSHKKDDLPRPAMHVLANTEQPPVVTRIKAVIHEGLILPLVQVLTHDRDIEIARKAFVALTNALINGTENQVTHIIGHGIMDSFANLLTSRDLWTVAKTLDVIEHILSMGGSLADEFVFVLESDVSTETRANRFCDSIEDAGIVDRVARLKNHQNEDIRQKALRIARYFG